MSEKILVTGGAGYIGAHTVHCLINDGIKHSDIIVFDNLINGNKNSIPESVKFVKGDLLNSNDIETVFKRNRIKKVIHFAAFAYVGESMDEPGKYFNNNVSGGINLLNAMQKYNCFNIVFSSSCSVYGVPNKIPITEKEAVNPINPYGESKLLFERILDWYKNIYNFKYISLRYFNAAGADYGIGEDHEPETHLIPLVIKSALNSNIRFKLYGDDYSTEDGTCIRDYIHVSDLALAHILSINYLDKNDKSLCLNLGTGKGISVKHVIELVEKISERKIKVSILSRRPGDPAILIADNRKAKKALGWQPKYDIEDIIFSAWNWHNK